MHAPEVERLKEPLGFSIRYPACINRRFREFLAANARACPQAASRLVLKHPAYANWMQDGIGPVAAYSPAGVIKPVVLFTLNATILFEAWFATWI
jgi:hypothetical protein